MCIRDRADPTPTLNASPPAACWGTAPDVPPAVDGQSVAVWCSTVWYPSSAATRVVTISACAAAETAASCASNPYLQAEVTFDDYPPLGVSAPPTTTPVPCSSYCGTTMTVNSWEWSPVVPTVSSISSTSGLSTSGLITGGTTGVPCSQQPTGCVTITGSGFVAGATTVNFVEESGGVPSSDSVIAPQPPAGSATVPAVGMITVPVSSVTVNGSGASLTAVVPAVDQGTTYLLTVTTPGGTSAYDPNPANPSANDIYTYLPNVSPSITSISPAGGSNTGGTAVSITGVGFYSSASNPLVVKFVGASTSAVVYVNSPTSITAFSPNVSPATGKYTITVTTLGGTYSNSNTDSFTYSQLPANGG